MLEGPLTYIEMRYATKYWCLLGLPYGRAFFKVDLLLYQDRYITCNLVNFDVFQSYQDSGGVGTRIRVSYSSRSALNPLSYRRLYYTREKSEKVDTLDGEVNKVL